MQDFNRTDGWADDFLLPVDEGKAEGRRQRAEGRGQKAEGRRQRAEGRKARHPESAKRDEGSQNAKARNFEILRRLRGSG
ncbi:MAG: hypothetical protein DMF56_16685 [Acidobacteria bacterium]|nr:MAG: hypothetical protein DMF56_16685 [Acidobacteriota bacterium]